ncbi:hypothetical protein [Haloarcula montana]|uniref:hypothetical protein n=1 Tax=Haloarcula montana TaxID=3111776 RepID=UPI002D76DE41|nr:hypothetical protein [Haloarcula sp. GH36]
MQRDYRLATYAFSIAIVLFAASGAALMAGASPSADPAEDSGTNTSTTKLNTDQQQDSETVRVANSTVYTFQQAQRTCSGALRLDSPNHTSTTHQVGNVTVTLVSHHDGMVVEEVGRQRLAERVVDATHTRAGLGAYTHLEVQVNQYYESTAREDPLDIAGIRVRPAEDCLPYVRGTLNGTNETMTVQTARPDVDEVRLNFTDGAESLDQDDQELIERLVVSDPQTSYNVRAHLDATTLQATVIEVADDDVDVELRRPDGNGSSLMVTVDLDRETVVTSGVEIQLDRSEITMADENSSIDVRNASETSDSVAIELNESNITVVNETGN